MTNVTHIDNLLVIFVFVWIFNAVVQWCFCFLAFLQQSSLGDSDQGCYAEVPQSHESQCDRSGCFAQRHWQTGTPSQSKTAQHRMGPSIYSEICECNNLEPDCFSGVGLQSNIFVKLLQQSSSLTIDHALNVHMYCNSVLKTTWLYVQVYACASLWCWLIKSVQQFIKKHLSIADKEMWWIKWLKNNFNYPFTFVSVSVSLVWDMGWCF